MGLLKVDPGASLSSPDGQRHDELVMPLAAGSERGSEAELRGAPLAELAREA